MSRAPIKWGSVLAVFMGIAGLVFGLFRNEQAKAGSAKAAQKIAEKDAEIAHKESAIANANAEASKVQVERVVAAKKAADQVANLRDDELDSEGESLGILRD